VVLARGRAGAERNVVSAGGQVEIGQRYRIARTGGGPVPTVWEVVRIYVPWKGGFEHACLKSVDGSAGRMTLATSVIVDKRRFVREG
jgi:hypothetical protein